MVKTLLTCTGQDQAEWWEVVNLTHDKSTQLPVQLHTTISIAVPHSFLFMTRSLQGSNPIGTLTPTIY